MCHMNRSRLAVLVLILGVHFAALPIFARKSPTLGSITFKLTPPAIDPPEPQASGRYTLTANTWEDFGTFGPIQVSVSCRRLTPGKQYYVETLVWWYDVWGNDGSYYVERAFEADRLGKLQGQFTVEGSYIFISTLWIQDGAGNVVLEEQR